MFDANRGGSAGPTVPPLVNNNPPVYAADNDYTKTIDDVLVTHLTTHIGKNPYPFSPSTFMFYREKALLIQRTWCNLTVRNSNWLFEA